MYAELFCEFGAPRTVICTRGTVSLYGYVRGAKSRVVLIDDWGSELELWPVPPGPRAIADDPRMRSVVTQLARIVYPWEMLVATAAFALPETRGYHDVLHYAMVHNPSMKGITLDGLMRGCGLADEFAGKMR